MSPKLQTFIEVELKQLRQLLEEHRPLLLKVRTIPPDGIERSAIAAMLHSFYTGIENIAKRIAVECDGGLPTGPMWHRALLDAMGRATPARPAVFATELDVRLSEFLQFRHVFRQAYSFQLQWEKMQPLVESCADILTAAEIQLRQWLQATRTE